MSATALLRENPTPERGRDPQGRSRATSAAAPATGTSSRRSRPPRGQEVAAVSETVAPDAAARRRGDRRDAARLRRPERAAQGGQAARPGRGRLRRRRQAARHGLRPLRPLAVRAREASSRSTSRRRSSARRRVRDADRRRGRDRSPTRSSRSRRRRARTSRTTRSRSARRATSASRSRRRRRDARARARRRRARRGRVRAAAGARRRARRARRRRAGPARRRRREPRLEGVYDWGDLDARVRRGGPRREDLASSTSTASTRRRSSATARSSSTTAAPASGRSTANNQFPGLRGDHDGAGAARRDRQAPLRHAGHRRRLRQQDHLAPAARRLLPARPQAQPAGPVDRVAHRLPPVDVARQRALVPGHRGRGQGRRHAARLPHEGARRRRRVPRATSRSAASSGRRSRPAATAGATSASTSRRSDEQGAGLAEPRLLAHAAPLVDRARSSTSSRTSSGSIPVEVRKRNYVRAEEMPYDDAERLRLRLGRLRALLDLALELIGYDRSTSGARRRVARQAARLRHRLDARLRHEQLRPVAADQPGAAVLGQQRGRDGEARHLRRDRRHARHGAAGPGPRDDGRAGRRRHPRLHARRRQRARRPRQLLELARRLLRHLREPVRRHRARRREGRGREARGRDQDSSRAVVLGAASTTSSSPRARCA